MTYFDALQFKLCNNRVLHIDGFPVRLYILPAGTNFKKYLLGYKRNKTTAAAIEIGDYCVYGIWGYGTGTKCGKITTGATAES